MNLSEIIKAYGDDKVQVQILANDMTRADDGKHDCKITFATERGTAMKMHTNKVIGLVVWMDRDRYESATRTHKPEAP